MITSKTSFIALIGNPISHSLSPIMQNAAFQYLGLDLIYIAIPCRNEDLKIVLNSLKKINCIGLNITIPFKETVFNLIKDNVEEEIKAIGAVNCFYRPRSSNYLTDEFTGTNTDGEAALDPLKKQLIESRNLNIGLLGYGGTGKAILAFLLKDFKRKHKIHIFNRSPINIKDYKEDDLYSYSLNELEANIPDFDLLINATSVGHVESIDMTPIPMKLLAKAKNTMVVYDIIYDPLKTKLLKNSEEIGLKTINGLRMNLIQAVLAYSYTNHTVLAKEEIYKIMN